MKYFSFIFTMVFSISLVAQNDSVNEGRTSLGGISLGTSEYIIRKNFEDLELRSNNASQKIYNLSRDNVDWMFEFIEARDGSYILNSVSYTDKNMSESDWEKKVDAYSEHFGRYPKINTPTESFPMKVAAWEYPLSQDIATRFTISLWPPTKRMTTSLMVKTW